MIGSEKWRAIAPATKVCAVEVMCSLYDKMVKVAKFFHDKNKDCCGAYCFRVTSPILCPVMDWSDYLAACDEHDAFSSLTSSLSKTHSNAAVSGLFLAYGVPSLVFGMAAGVIVDRLDRRLVLIVSHFGRAILTLVLLLVPDAVWLTYVIIFAHALITQLTVPAEAPLIPKLVGESTLLVPAISLFTFTFYASLAIGVIAAGPLLRLVGAHGAQLLSSHCFVSLAYLCTVCRVRAKNYGVYASVSIHTDVYRQTIDQ